MMMKNWKFKIKGTAGEQLFPEEAERHNHNLELSVQQDQQTVPNLAVPTEEQANLVAEQNDDQADETEHATVLTREFVPKP